MARANPKAVTDLDCPFFSINSVRVKCLGEDCALFAAVSDPTIVGRGRMLTGCALVVGLRLQRALSW